MAFDYSLHRLNKQMARETNAGRIAHEKALYNAEPVSTAAKRAKSKPRGERPETAAKRERQFLYGKFDPANGISECCYMVRAANGTCTGCGE